MIFLVTQSHPEAMGVCGDPPRAALPHYGKCRCDPQSSGNQDISISRQIPEHNTCSTNICQVEGTLKHQTLSGGRETGPGVLPADPNTEYQYPGEHRRGPGRPTHSKHGSDSVLWGLLRNSLRVNNGKEKYFLFFRNRVSLHIPRFP